MGTWLSKLVDTADFPARWFCGSWTQTHGWTHIAADLLIFAAYFAIPWVLFHMARRRTDIPFSRVFFLFGIFILSCGTIHLIEAIIFWQPIYRVSALVKVITAVVSWATVFALIRAFPLVLEYRSPESMRVEKKLRRSNEELERFAYAASHDLKAPLNAITQLAGWIAEEVDTDANGETGEHLRLLRGRAERMRALLDGLLAYSRATQGPSEVLPVDTEYLMGDIRDLVAVSSPNVLVEVQTPMPRFETHVTPLHQVLTNLVTNGAKHRDVASGRVTVSARDVGEFYEFCVADDGPGIDPRYHERIFQVFQTLRPRDEVESTGIGLAIVQKVVTSHGGRVWVESAPNEGSRFYFTWPKAIVWDHGESVEAQPLLQ
jgi:signal transduction histidine kinase